MARVQVDATRCIADSTRPADGERDMNTVSKHRGGRRGGLRGLLPIGDTLDDSVWRQRHHLLVGLLSAHLPALILLGLWWHVSLGHTALEIAPAALCVYLALRLPGRRPRAVLSTIGLVWCSVTLVDFSGGAIEAYFHFFVVIAFIALYQDWVAFSMAVLFTVASHGVTALFGSRMTAQATDAHSAWVAALINGFAVVSECVALVLLWRGSESEQRRAANLATELTSAELARAQLLAEQRATTGALLTNLARRNQALLHRQLAKIDELEAREENAEALAELFALDHLATRMRRNAESLLVLSGEELPRRWSPPVPVGDVLRGAVAEIEDFQRVDVTLDGEADLNGRAVVDVVHLIAELIENATVFSGPLTRVAVHGAPVSNGYQITVTDRGVGLGAAELLGQRASLRGEGSDDLGLSGMLGFRVVARLAQRFDVGIELASEQGRGTVVTVTLPAALFVADDEADDLSPSAPAEALAAPAVPVEAFPPPALPVEAWAAAAVDSPLEPSLPEAMAEIPAVLVEPLPTRRPLKSLPIFSPITEPASASALEPVAELVEPAPELVGPAPELVEAVADPVQAPVVEPAAQPSPPPPPARTLGVPRQYVPADWTVAEPSWEDALPPTLAGPVSPKVAPAPAPAPAPVAAAAFQVPPPAYPPAPAAFPVGSGAGPVGAASPLEDSWPVDVPEFTAVPAVPAVPAAEAPAPALTSAGLVRRVPLANLAPQMTGVPVAPVLPADSVAMPAPERARSLLSTYRDGLTLGRAEPPVSATEPAAADSANPGAPA